MQTYKTFSGIIFLAQCFGIFPLVGINGPSVSDLQFKWKSFRFFYGMAVLLLVLSNLLFFIVQVSDIGLHFGSLVTLLFFGCAFVTTCLFLHLSRKWPTIMQEWNKVDIAMESNYGFPQKLHRNFNFVAALIIGMSLVEHAFFMTFSITNSPSFKNSTNSWRAMNGFFEKSFTHVFSYMPYHLILGFTVEFVNINCTFSWNYMDLFIIVTSIALAARFRQVNERIKLILEKINGFDGNDIDLLLPYSSGNVINENKSSICWRENCLLWMEIREDYNRLSHLTRTIDDALAYIIVLSFANNLFVILVQLLHSIESKDDTEILDRLYFVYSFGFLISRTSAVALSASKIYSESRKPPFYLNTELSNAYYNEEIERLLMEIRSTGGCYLSGNGFFKVRSSLILGIAGAIVSYELIFIQFNVH